MKTIVMLTTSIILLAASSCRKKCYDKSNSECENYDPCYGKTATTAEFTQKIPFGDIFVNVDSFAGPIWEPFNGVVYFKTISDFDSCIWTHGVETIKNIREFNRNSYPSNSQIKTQLVLYKKPNNTCFSNDNGIDTVIKTFAVARDYGFDNVIDKSLLKDTNDWIPLFGTYEGFCKSDPSKKRIIKIGFKYRCIDCSDIQSGFYFVGLPYENSTVLHNKVKYFDATHYSMLNIQPTGFYLNVGNTILNYNLYYEFKGYSFLQKANSNIINIKFSYCDSTNYDKNNPNRKRINDEFVGLKIDDRLNGESCILP